MVRLRKTPDLSFKTATWESVVCSLNQHLLFTITRFFWAFLFTNLHHILSLEVMSFARERLNATTHQQEFNSDDLFGFFEGYGNSFDYSQQFSTSQVGIPTTFADRTPFAHTWVIAKYRKLLLSNYSSLYTNSYGIEPAVTWSEVYNSGSPVRILFPKQFIANNESIGSRPGTAGAVYINQ